LVLEGNAGTKLEEYGPELIHEKTLDFITDNSQNPFFLYVPTIIPHAELIVPEEIMKNYRGRFVETPYEGVDEGEDYKIGGYMSQEEPRAAFVAMVELLDKQVGEIVAKLEELGIRDNTMIIFTSDNGPHKEGGADPDFFNSNGPWRGYKRDLYEGGIRVPMIANWPGKIKPGQTDHISAFWDIYPTIAELTGSELPKNTDGISFAPILTGNKDNQDNHEYLYWEFIEQGGKQAIRKGKWKAIRLNLRKNNNPPIELYNLEEDPSEENNLAEQYPDLVKEFKKLMESNHSPNPVFKLYASELEQ
jgi:arylsulfatase A-like enzyme